MIYRHSKWLLWLLFFIGQQVTAQIYFIARNLGPSTNIFSTDINGVITKITEDNRWRDMRADVATNGDIVFMSNRVANPKIDLHKQIDFFNLFRFEAKSKNIEQLTDNQFQNESPKISPDANQLAFIRRKDTHYELVITNLNGDDPKVLIKTKQILDFSWSPDKQSIALVLVENDQATLARIVIKTGARQNLLPKHLSDKKMSESKIQIASAQYSPDGNTIAYISGDTDQPSRILHILDLTTMNEKTLSALNLQVQSPVTWSHDSHQILYSALKDYQYYFDEKTQRKVYKGSMQIYLSNLKGETKQITDGNFLHKHPVFSPDERKIAYLFAPGLGDRTLALITSNLDGTDKRQLHSNVAANSMLTWK